jgi:hypothetical protein
VSSFLALREVADRVHPGTGDWFCCALSANMTWEWNFHLGQVSCCSSLTVHHGNNRLQPLGEYNQLFFGRREL